MRNELELKIKPVHIQNIDLITEMAADKLQIKKVSITHLQILRKSIDARGKNPVYRLRIEVFQNEEPPVEARFLDAIKPLPSNSKSVIIIGAGPAGYFAALELLENGVRPIIFERGKDVRARRRDLKAIQQKGIVDPHSNYCFGEGGAGTYSDGKLYTRSHKRGNINKSLKLLVEHGATEEILIDAHPHIGSNKLPNIVANIRKTILANGGEIHFNSCVTDFIIKDRKMLGVVVNRETEHLSDSIILATGHSARDIYYLLQKHKVQMESKPFALGVRIEHPQALIDSLQYNQHPREQNLPASSYRLACQVKERGVFSFCMCPGGLVVPAATAPGEIVVNGMSLSRRDSSFANSGTVVAIDPKELDVEVDDEIFKGLEFQKQVERNVFLSGNGSQAAPAQRLTDFVNGAFSNSLPSSSYIPGLFSAPVHELLPSFIYEYLREGIFKFGKKMNGYLTSEANVIATESRTSSPIKVPRNKETYMHEQIVGLFPCGEGAGFAGGIISAAVDGQNVAKAVCTYNGVALKQITN